MLCILQFVSFDYHWNWYQIRIVSYEWILCDLLKNISTMNMEKSLPLLIILVLVLSQVVQYSLFSNSKFWNFRLKCKIFSGSKSYASHDDLNRFDQYFIANQPRGSNEEIILSIQELKNQIASLQLNQARYHSYRKLNLKFLVSQKNKLNQHVLLK